MSEKRIKTYEKDGLTVVWEPGKCIHSTKCWKSLPEVFKPRSKPWVDLEGASANAVRETVQKCPSGALSIQGESTHQPTGVSAEIMRNGPVLIKGDIEVKAADGTITQSGPVTAFCRCGASNNKPFCDGTHKNTDFQG